MSQLSTYYCIFNPIQFIWRQITHDKFNRIISENNRKFALQIRQALYRTYNSVFPVVAILIVTRNICYYFYLQYCYTVNAVFRANKLNYFKKTCKRQSHTIVFWVWIGIKWHHFKISWRELYRINSDFR